MEMTKEHMRLRLERSEMSRKLCLSLMNAAIVWYSELTYDLDPSSETTDSKHLKLKLLSIKVHSDASIVSH